MPAPAKESRLPELRLPRIDRDEIIRAFSEIKLPDLRSRAAEIPEIKLPSADSIQKVVDDAAVKTGIRAPRRPRISLIAGFAIIAGLVIYAMTRPAVRTQLEKSGRVARERIDEMRRQRETIAIEPDDVAMPVAPDAWTDKDVAAPVAVVAESIDAAAGAGRADEIPAFEESGSTNPV